MIDDFAADGQLAKAIPGFKPREPQRQMAVAVSEAIEASRPLVVEAGTGTGKTYAYLAPALRAKNSISFPPFRVHSEQCSAHGRLCVQNPLLNAKFL